MSQSGQRSKWYLSNNSKTTEANLTKLHRKIEHNGKVCRAQEVGSFAQGQGHNRQFYLEFVKSKTIMR